MRSAHVEVGGWVYRYVMLGGEGFGYDPNRKEPKTKKNRMLVRFCFIMNRSTLVRFNLS
jgi:hypothetical protein